MAERGLSVDHTTIWRWTVPAKKVKRVAKDEDLPAIHLVQSREVDCQGPESEESSYKFAIPVAINGGKELRFYS